MQANEEPSQAMSTEAHLQQRVPMISSDQCSPDKTHEWTMLSHEAEIMASEISPISPHENYGINLDTHQHEDLSIPGAGIRRKPISVTTHPSAQQTPEGPDEGPQPTSASAERLDAAKRATETLKPTWKIWALEIACIVLSTLLIGVIIVVLLKYDSQVQPKWPFEATLNSFLALFTTLAKAAFMVSVCACISQSQWAWLNANGVPRSLYDFELIDQASRGAWGSLILLSRFRFRHFVVLGALLTAISALTSPITQLSIKYSQEEMLVAKEATGSQATTQAVRDLMYPRDKLESAIRFASYQTSFLDYENFQKPLPIRMYRPYGQWTMGVFNVPGRATTMATYVKITWPWVMLLVAEIAAAAVLLVITIIYSTGGSDSNYRDLKSSSLGTLVALSPACRTAAGEGLQPVDALKKLAKGLKVQLIGSHIVVAEDETDETPSQETSCGVSGAEDGAPREMDRTQE
ncbi:hypothetical protein CTAM01_13896 [Colletotrichum tamarilloi]|uniref:Uncharacterized protein n=1 Tax=Colletotrichum tamarilloi TaxID=1209934 RepID=A0ABQ9QQV0_9PEZI|nr:uncharacterized protein CTAM01_13896 [Colletotrichum tamarilloi]KAK1481736.1 hypothetical protein CTAM01_13896 [Colletotrichum tamarilloi]